MAAGSRSRCISCVRPGLPLTCHGGGPAPAVASHPQPSGAGIQHLIQDRGLFRGPPPLQKTARLRPGARRRTVRSVSRPARRHRDFIAADPRPADRLSSKLALTAADFGMRGAMAVMRLGPGTTAGVGRTRRVGKKRGTRATLKELCGSRWGAH